MNSNPLNRFERLSVVAAQESAPVIDVADQVLTTLASRSISPRTDREMVTFSVASVIAAALAISILWVESTDEAILALIQPFISASP